MIGRDKIFGNNNLINLIKLIFYPWFKLHQEILIVIRDPQDWFVSGLFIGFIGSMLAVSSAYFAITPTTGNFFNSILKLCPINNHIFYNLCLWHITTSTASYIGYYLSTVAAKLYCYLSTGHPNIYLNKHKIQLIIDSLNNKGYYNIDREILLEIIQFCISKAQNNKNNILANHMIDWEYTLEHLMESDLEYFLEQQYILRNQRKKYIRKIISFYVYHRDCHHKAKQQKSSINDNRKNSGITATDSTNQSSVQSNIINNLELNQVFSESNKSFDEKILLFSTLDSKVAVSSASVEAAQKDYLLFKQDTLKQSKNKNISPYQEYLMLDKYEQFLYRHASEISGSIFPEEIITLIELHNNYLQIPSTQDNSINFTESFIYYPPITINNLSDLSGLGSRQSTFTINDKANVSLKIE